MSGVLPFTKDILSGILPETSHNFLVVIGAKMMGFSKVSGIVLDNRKYKEFLEGGTKTPHLLKDDVDSTNTLTLERGISYFDVVSLLSTKLKFVLIAVLDNKRKIKQAFFATDAVFERLELSDLNAMSQEIMINKLILRYTTMVSVPAAIFMPIPPLPKKDLSSEPMGAGASKSSTASSLSGNSLAPGESKSAFADPSVALGTATEAGTAVSGSLASDTATSVGSANNELFDQIEKANTDGINASNELLAAKSLEDGNASLLPLDVEF